MGLQLQPWVEKTVDGVATDWLSRKEKIPDVAVSKEGDAVDFYEKGATVNSAFYCQLLRQNWPFLLNDPHIISVQNFSFTFKYLKNQQKKRYCVIILIMLSCF